jgi:hypothetical protein
LVSNIKDSSSSKFAHDYSKIFHDEATTHSRIRLFSKKDEKFNKKGIGLAEWYMLFGILLIGVLFYLVFNNYFIPNSSDLSETLESIASIGLESVTYTQLVIPYFIKKLIVLAILLFGIKFAFRQFSIHKHLHTLNIFKKDFVKSLYFSHRKLFIRFVF